MGSLFKRVHILSEITLSFTVILSHVIFRGGGRGGIVSGYYRKHLLLADCFCD